MRICHVQECDVAGNVAIACPLRPRVIAYDTAHVCRCVNDALLALRIAAEEDSGGETGGRTEAEQDRERAKRGHKRELNGQEKGEKGHKRGRKGAEKGQKKGREAPPRR